MAFLKNKRMERNVPSFFPIWVYSLNTWGIILHSNLDKFVISLSIYFYITLIIYQYF